MELDDEVKSASEKLTDAVNAAAGESESVSEAVIRLREMGYEPRLTFQLELARIEANLSPEVPAAAEMEEDFSEEDRKALRRMLIRVR